ncbi:hypothetical protein GTW78_20420 [Streptomyces sp. SID4948]|nr:hypothetical protein [Streptomyces sp. SID4948]
MGFRFGLTPLERVTPWGGEHPVLHWFALTDGWYCIDLDGHEVLRYSERTVQALRSDPEAGPPHPYVDYYVVRLWEDVIALVSEAMEPVPEDVADAVEVLPDSAWPETPEAEAASTWHSAGYLNTSYLRVAPRIRCWRSVVGDADAVTVAWEQQVDPEGVIEFAGPPAGRVVMPTGEFLAAVTELDRSLLAAMDQRISDLEHTNVVPRVDVDIGQLRREHLDRATWLQRARNHDPGTDWDAVREGVQQLLDLEK